MTFDTNGNLVPYNDINVSMEELYDVFVEPYSSSSTRIEVYQQLISCIESFEREVNSQFIVFVDGSFVTKKQNPNDVDIAIFIDDSVYEEAEQKGLLSSFKGRQRFPLVDGYIVKMYPTTHRYYVRYQSDEAYWYDLFTRNRRRERKGFLTIKVGYES